MLWVLAGWFWLWMDQIAGGAVQGARAPNPLKKSPPGIVFMIDGVGGLSFSPKMMELALTEAMVPHELRQFYWSHGFGRWHEDLTDAEGIRAKASELAGEIMEFRIQRPGAPVFLIAKSGGTAVASTCLAQLPDASVERCVLLSAAVSPEFDLVPALRAVRTDLFSFWSPRDRLVLGVGTTFFGTADGVQSESAGLVGFRVPENATEETQRQYAKLRQVEWTPKMTKSLNFGTHIGTSMPQFVRDYVAPLVGGQAPRDEE